MSALNDYLDGMRAATTAKELECAIQKPFKHPFGGPTWSRICSTRIDAGHRICDAHPLGRFVPRLGPRHRLTVFGYGQNSTGVRYCGHYAQQWCEGVLRDNGFTMRAANRIWESSFDYPHRALKTVESALAGKLPDPRFHRLIPHKQYGHEQPVRIDRETKDRAHRPCKCGGWLWDWGSGWNGYATFLNWHCDRCPRVYTEYVTAERFANIRRPRRAA